MKLKGSKTEEDLRAQLRASREGLFRDPANERLLAGLRSHFPNLTSAYVLSWTPDQGEDIFTVLIDTATVAFVELDRIHAATEPRIDSMSVAEYLRHRLGRPRRLKMAVAIDLAEADLRARTGTST